MTDQQSPEGTGFPHLAEYRAFLIAAEQKSQESFDKAVLTLSGGALGVSFVFLKDIIGSNPIVQPALLFTAWVSWGLSTLAILASYYLSHLALRRTIAQVDAGTIYSSTPGGSFAKWTAGLNAGGAALFMIGVCSMTLFANANLSTEGVNNGRTKTAPTSSSASPSSAPSSASAAAATGR